MTQELFIPGPLPGMNELIAAAKGAGGRGYLYAKLKREWTETVASLAKARLTHVETAWFRFDWYEKGRRRDPDNVAAGGRKLILDGLVAAGILTDDNWTRVLGWADYFNVDAKRPGVAVMIDDSAV